MKQLKPIEKTYYIAYENEIIHHGIIDANQSFATALANFDTFTDINNWVDKLSALGIEDIDLPKLDSAKRDKISEVKKEAGRLINSKYPSYKQINYSLAIEVNDYNNTTKINEMKAYLKSIIEQSETMESEINALKTEQEVKDYQINFTV